MTKIRRTLALAAAAAAALAVLAPAPGTAAGASFHVVRFAERITDASRAAVVSAGLTVVDYLPQDSYIVRGAPDAVARARSLPGVAGVEALRPEAKIGRDLAGRAGLVPYVEAGVWGADLASTLEFLGGFGTILRAYPVRAGGTVVHVGLPLAAADLARVAAHPSVLYLSGTSFMATPEDEATDQIQAGNLGATNRPVPGYEAWLASVGLNGSGVKVTIVDTGLSRWHPDFAARGVEYVNYTAQPDGTDSGGHGTHVAGIAGGAPSAATGALKDLDGHQYGLGVAPKVGLVSQNYLESGLPAGGFPRITKDALARGARIWNASWYIGPNAGRQGYTGDARTMDELARDGNLDAAGAQEFLLVFSAGNTGQGGPTAPKEAKNIVAVGATLSGRDLASRRPAGNPDLIASFSAVGPTVDGRIFPTVVAPGDIVDSAAAPEGAGLAGACIPAALSAGVYTACSGTSMAAPHVTGAAALIHQWWQATRSALPSPTLVKALLVNGATDMATKNVPNKNEGWGRVNLSAVFATTPLVARDQQDTFGAPGESSTLEVDLADATKPLRVTLAWADAPAAVQANPTLVNDLDLVVSRLDGSGAVVATWRGNVFSGGQSVAGGNSDRLNNLENVWLPVPGAGRYRITVSAHNVPGDGVPGNADLTDQDFVLLVRNATAV